VIRVGLRRVRHARTEVARAADPVPVAVRLAPGRRCSGSRQVFPTPSRRRQSGSRSGRRAVVAGISTPSVSPSFCGGWRPYDGCRTHRPSRPDPRPPGLRSALGQLSQASPTPHGVPVRLGCVGDGTVVAGVALPVGIGVALGTSADGRCRKRCRLRHRRRRPGSRSKADGQLSQASPI
jgi:hypothetical protein